MIDRSHELPLAAQAHLLDVARSTVYREAKSMSAADLCLMRRIDELHLDYPFAGSRMLRSMLANEGIAVGRRHLRALMRRMGIEALYRRPRTSRPWPGHKIHPYLLRDLAIVRPGQVWAADITYIPMTRGFVYLVVVLDWFSRRPCRGGYRSRWMWISASKPWKRRWLGMVPPKYSTRIGEASSPARRLSVC